MDTDIKQIGIFGLSFSRGMDQTWFNLWHKDNGYSADIFQFVMDDDVEESYIEDQKMITFEQGEELLAKAFEDGKIEEWQPKYTADGEEGEETEFTWTLDIDDLAEQDILFFSGNGKLPSNEMMMGVIKAIRLYEPRFATCFKEFQE